MKKRLFPLFLALLLLLSACGILITAVTAVIMPQSLVIMGVLSFFGLDRGRVGRYR